MIRKIPGFSLFLLIVASIDSVRNLPSAAVFGSSIIFFYTFAAIAFLIPMTLVCAELAASSTKEGGLYHWVRKGFGEKWGMTAAWLHWIDTIVWFPSFLSFVAATAAYLFDPDYATNKIYLVSVILILYWLVTILSLFGVRISSMVSDVCVLGGTALPMLLLIVLGIVWIVSGYPSQIAIDSRSLVSTFANGSGWVSLIAIMASFSGVEIAGVHVKDVYQPKKYFPRAMIAACVFIFATMLLGSLVVAWVLPNKEIELASGIVQTFEILFLAFGLKSLIPLIVLLVLLGTIGSLIHWHIAPSRGLIEAAEHGYIPRFLAKKNSHGAPPNMLLLQGGIVSLFSLTIFLVDTVNGFYWFLLSLSTSLAMLVYCLILLSALVQRHRNRDCQTFCVPGKLPGLYLAVALGLFSCIATIIVSFFPPEEVDIGSPLRYTIMIAVGIVLFLFPMLFFFWHKRTKAQ